MKILRCHIENFGTLSDWDIEFQDGLTEICAPNGFGKTTLAVFIKCMFYGLSHKRPKNISGNERKKYEPWQDGPYGGSLDFEYQGTEYRVTRFFGKTAVKDSFSLYDLTNRKESRKFSRDLGNELFQLDDEAFARSTYIPQMMDVMTKTPAAIQSKLSNMVDSTDDLNNFDTALDKLKATRSQFQAYRGNGGIVHRLREQIDELNVEYEKAKKDVVPLEEISRDIVRLSERQEEEQKVVNHLRETIRQAANQKALTMQKKRGEELKAEYLRLEQEVGRLDMVYAQGYPNQHEIAEQRANRIAYDEATAKLSQMTIDGSDMVRATKGQQRFGEAQEFEPLFKQCQNDYQALRELYAKDDARADDAEKERFAILKARFNQGIPAEIELTQIRKSVNELIRLQEKIRQTQLSQADARQLDDLRNFFGENVPDGQVLDDCERTLRENEQLQQERARTVTSDQEDLERLKRTFAHSVPSEEAIHDAQEKCKRIHTLNAKKEVQTTVVQSQGQSAAKKSKAPMLSGILGVLLLLAGIFFFVTSQMSMAAVLTVAGLVALIAAVGLSVKQNSNASEQMVVRGSAISEEENQELFTLQHELNDFILQFYASVTDPEQQLVALLMDRRQFLDLQERHRAQEKRSQELEQRMAENKRRMQEVFEQFFPGEVFQTSFVADLRNRKKAYQDLVQKQKESHREKLILNVAVAFIKFQLIKFFVPYVPTFTVENAQIVLDQLVADVREFNLLNNKFAQRAADEKEDRELIERKENAIHRFLEKYQHDAETASLEEAISALEADFKQYQEAALRVQTYEKERKLQTEKFKQAEESLLAFSRKYFLQEQLLSSEQIEQCAADLIEHESLMISFATAKQQYAAFTEENPDYAKETVDASEVLEDPDVYQTEEKEAQTRLSQTDENLRNLRAERDRLLRSVEKIPGYEDQMTRLVEQQNKALENVALLDKAMAFMQQAKDHLSNSYVGTVERQFVTYVEKFFSRQKDVHVMIDKDLQIKVEEQGMFHEVEYYSAGLTDIFVLCMRFALVDALFEHEKPPLILDDPFVNLDDHHMNYALELLKILAEQYQIVYLVCNTNRAVEIAK